MAQTAFPEGKEKIKILQAGNKGFTLLELMLVIVLAGLSMAIVVVAVGKEHEKTIFKETSRKVFLLLKHARETALLEKTQVTFRIDEKNNLYWMEKNEVLSGRVQNTPEHINIRGDTIIFFPKGNSSGGLIKINDDKGREYSIEVDPVLGIPSFKRI